MKRTLLSVFAVSAVALVGCQQQEPQVDELPAAEEAPATTPVPAMPMDTMGGMMQSDTMQM